jgi:CRISPR system Cascade subunit CasC
MRLLEFHILQQFPATCLNRDDNNSPKSMVFGGVDRGRISSQCLKRAARLHAQHEFPEAPFKGFRTRRLVGEFLRGLSDAGFDGAGAEACAASLAQLFSKLEAKDPGQVTTAVYLSPGEIKTVCAAAAAHAKNGTLPQPPELPELPEGATDKQKADAQKRREAALEEAQKAYRKAFSQTLKTLQRLDAADIAFFGRMIANDKSLSVEAAAMFSHALSTHGVEIDLDFYTAVDERTQDEPGAAMMGHLQFSSATYYRYAALNLDLLFDAGHLGGFNPEQRRAALEAFIRSVLMAVPGARRNAMNGHTLPSYVLGFYKEKGQPVQLCNAFDPPVSLNGGGDGLVDASIKRLLGEDARLRKTWGVQPTAEVSIPDVGIEEFCQTLIGHALP